MDVLSEAQMRALFKTCVNAYKYEKYAAKALGISPQYLSDVLNGRRAITQSIADRLGYERVVRFVAKPRKKAAAS